MYVGIVGRPQGGMVPPDARETANIVTACEGAREIPFSYRNVNKNGFVAILSSRFGPGIPFPTFSLCENIRNNMVEREFLFLAAGSSFRLSASIRQMYYI